MQQEGQIAGRFETARCGGLPEGLFQFIRPPVSPEQFSEHRQPFRITR